MKKGFKFKICAHCGKAIRGGYSIWGRDNKYYHHNCATVATHNSLILRYQE